jgi:thiamine pyrophosphokinase
MISTNDVMRWKSYLQQIESYSGIDVVGPLAIGTEDFSRPTLFIDGGARFRPRESVLPMLTLGDGDSGYELHMDICFPKEKDVSDLGTVLGLLPNTITDLNLHGFLGGRRDHELANFGEVQKFLTEAAQDKAVTFFKGTVAKVRAFSKGTQQLGVSGTFSIFLFGGGSFTVQGDCKYPIRQPRAVTELSSLGLSNEGDGRITITATMPFFVFT